jgi:hypothetical protein
MRKKVVVYEMGRSKIILDTGWMNGWMDGIGD